MQRLSFLRAASLSETEKRAAVTDATAASTNRACSAPVVHATSDELVERALSLTVAGGRRMLGITGTPGAGKSTLCAALLDELGRNAVLVGMDGFHFASSELARLGRADRKGAPDTFDVDGYVALLSRLRRPGPDPIYAPVFNRGIEEPIGSAVQVAADVPLVITEGNYLLLDVHGWGAVRNCLDEVWFLDVDPVLRERRLVLRRQLFGHSVADAQSWVSSVDEKNAATTSATRGRADFVVHLTTLLGTQAPAAATNEELRATAAPARSESNASAGTSQERRQPPQTQPHPEPKEL